MSTPLVWVDAFTDVAFRGNPAGVCVLDAAADPGWMQSVAFELNISETAFLVARADGAYDLRWFTPTREIELCGHATLASAHVLFTSGAADTSVSFHTMSGVLTCTRAGARIEMDFPAAATVPCATPDGLLAALGLTGALAVSESANRWLVVEVESAAEVRELRPDFARLAGIGSGAAIVTARSDVADAHIVSRVFVPGAGIDEDPVTGSAHCTLVPYWATKLDRTDLVAHQASPRGGTLHCRLAGDRVFLAGAAVTVLRADLEV
ncbi:MAG: PhzF family phenazine biosynthesis protein [Acidimicrobiia bacterium]